MCGLFGAVFLKPNVQVNTKLASKALAHRGPDHRRTFEREGGVLGHTRLSVLDLSSGANQPMVFEEKSLALVFNGEIYNFKELKAELIQRNHVFSTHSDTEVLLKGYLEWGSEVTKKLHGMFAFAVWNWKENTLFLARDRVGKKPLFYAHTEDGFYFASETEALFALGVPKDIRAQSLISMFTFGAPRAPLTMYQNVFQLEKSHQMQVSCLGQKVSVSEPATYYRQSFSSASEYSSEAEAMREISEALDVAISRRMVADVPVGALLSGGVDSSLVVALMRKFTTEFVHTFSVGFEGDPLFDETEHAKSAAKTLGTVHHELRLNASCFDVLPELVRVHDGPFVDSSAIPTSQVCKLAKEHVTVALSGDGGDEVFAGYERFRTFSIAQKIPFSMRKKMGECAQLIPEVKTSAPFVSKLKRLLEKSGRPMDEQMLSWVSPDAFRLQSVFRQDFAEQFDLNLGLKENKKIVQNLQAKSPLKRALEYNYETYLSDDLLLKADRASMFYGLEVRAPFLDTELMTRASRLPNGMLIQGMETKYLLKKIASQYLPKSILYRKKMGFGLPLGAWFRSDLRSFLEDYLSPSALLYEYISKDFVAGLKRDLYAVGSGRADPTHTLFTLLTLEIWLHQQAKTKDTIVSA